MKLVILGKGGQGVIFFSRVIAQASINKGLSVCSTEIKGMAKKGGAVEIQMKIGEGMSGMIRRGTADMVVLLSRELLEYAKTFSENTFAFTDDEIQTARASVPMRYVNTFLLGVFVKKTKLFECQDFINILDEENKKSFIKGCDYVQS
ncbi:MULTISPECIES: 2-oxoacid:acceptor oxidoreductase family protein [Thermodesulfovibrio]|uniref:Indolepyruvate oxidoreductase subunit IorB n=2 Tax=Thermodesulfovibrio yellowstonii TaxID=28262 RepID=B5YGU7_THEYD|nr:MULTISPECIES: 2-oxoacid:acceptor oxidoreductase family protein [Thermodesulfovibrio]ACI21486.1 indolepyruvate oxidoreductase subunit IorB [Thermodesulfovibrio yellowstonii DSM 11347]MDI6865400.1 2-oxoacid:acceptor oxidoreductase family protein [Thermodesulfovibrio yellowstonii]GLI52552.1 indolepyruvate oxidoreductase subunit IorB [Thermodesulfovibrio islandicus]